MSISFSQNETFKHLTKWSLVTGQWSAVCKLNDYCVAAFHRIATVETISQINNYNNNKLNGRVEHIEKNETFNGSNGIGNGYTIRHDGNKDTLHNPNRKMKWPMSSGNMWCSSLFLSSSCLAAMGRCQQINQHQPTSSWTFLFNKMIIRLFSMWIVVLIFLAATCVYEAECSIDAIIFEWNQQRQRRSKRTKKIEEKKIFLHSSSSVECCGVFNLKPSTATGTTYIIVDFIFGRFSSEMRKQQTYDPYAVHGNGSSALRCHHHNRQCEYGIWIKLIRWKEVVHIICIVQHIHARARARLFVEQCLTLLVTRKNPY